MTVRAVPPCSVEVQPRPCAGRLTVSSGRSRKLTEDFWFSSKRLNLMLSLEVKKKIKQLKRDASSTPITLLWPCLLPVYSHILHPHSSAASKSIPGLSPALHVHVLLFLTFLTSQPRLLIPGMTGILQWNVASVHWKYWDVASACLKAILVLTQATVQSFYLTSACLTGAGSRFK